MSKIPDDLWPADIGADVIVTPVSILKKQASALAAKTNNVLGANIRTSRGDDYIFHYFDIVAPAIDNYTYSLFYITHKVELYPLTIGFESKSTKVNTPEELIDNLRIVFSSEKTRRVVASLLSQSADE